MDTSSYAEGGNTMMNSIRSTDTWESPTASRTCDSFLLPNVEFRTLQAEETMCGMQVAGAPLIPNEAGWVTNAA